MTFSNLQQANRGFPPIRILPVLVWLFCLTAAPCHLQAQNDRHYNTQQYGLRGMILNGAMVAGVDDNSAIFYNPSALSTSPNEGLDISLFAASLELFKKKNGTNTGSAPRQVNAGLIPGMITFSKRPFKNKRVSLAGASLTRHDVHNALSEQYLEYTEGMIRVNDIDFEHSLLELWLAGAAAYAFDNGLAIGMTQFLSIRRERYEHDISYKGFDTDVPGRLLYEDAENLLFRQNHTIGLRNKFGLSWHNDFFRIGATLTTPMYARVLKSADVKYHRAFFDADTSYARTVFDKQKGRERTPFIARLGLEVRQPSFLIAVSAEYFHPVKDFDRFAVQENPDFVPGSGQRDFLLADSRKRVVNLNLGWEVRLIDKLWYLGGFRTNFNYNELPSGYEEPRFHFSYFDIYHLTTGFKASFGRNTFTIGCDYAFSFQDGLPVLADLTAASLQPAGPERSSVAYNNLTFLFTYNFLLDRISQVLEQPTEGKRQAN